jgi:hypothetical protein
MVMSVEQSVEGELAGETEVLGENLYRNFFGDLMFLRLISSLTEIS